MKNLWKTSTLSQKICGILLVILFICCVYWSISAWFPEKPNQPEIVSTDETSDVSKGKIESIYVTGLNDIAKKINEFSFRLIPDSVKAEISEMVKADGGTIEFEKDCWIITMEDGTLTFYSDNTYTIVDNNGKIVVDRYNH